MYIDTDHVANILHFALCQVKDSRFGFPAIFRSSNDMKRVSKKMKKNFILFSLI